MKAGREYCLRCFSPLPTAEKPLPVPVWESLGLSKQTKIVMGVAAMVVVAALVAVIWTSEMPVVDESDSVSLRPAASPVAPAAGAPAATPSGAALPMPSVPHAAVRGPETPADVELERQRDEYLTRLARTPNDAATLNALGLLLEKMGQNDDALTRFERAIALEPRTPAFRMNFANLAAALGQWGRAIDQYRETLLLARQDYAAQYALAIALQRKGDDELAIAEFTKARRLKQGEPAIALGLAASLERIGRKDEAVREYRDFLALQPNSSDADKVRVHLSTLSRP
jgi:Tfp pilus assembly protein PilF